MVRVVADCDWGIGMELEKGETRFVARGILIVVFRLSGGNLDSHGAVVADYHRTHAMRSARGLLASISDRDLRPQSGGGFHRCGFARGKPAQFTAAS